MELYNMLKNISGKNNEEELINAISTVRKKLNGLVEERMCKVYSGFLFEELRKQHIPVRLINTLDLGLQYEHIFILVPSNTKGYFLVGLTFSQFNTELEKLNQLIVNGYQLINDDDLNYYLNIINKEKFNNQISVEDIFYLSELSNKRKL